MSRFSTEVPHQLGKEQAAARIKAYIEQVRTQYQDQVSRMDGQWESHTLTFSVTTYGMTVDGTLDVCEDLIRVDGKLPLAAMMFKAKITESLRDAMEKALA
jgi:putative polyhydroxyalkanoate system protein